MYLPVQYSVISQPSDNQSLVRPSASWLSSEGGFLVTCSRWQKNKGMSVHCPLVNTVAVIGFCGIIIFPVHSAWQ